MGESDTSPSDRDKRQTPLRTAGGAVGEVAEERAHHATMRHGARRMPMAPLSASKYKTSKGQTPRVDPRSIVL